MVRTERHAQRVLATFMSQSPQGGAMVRTIFIVMIIFSCISLNPLKAGQWFGPICACSPSGDRLSLNPLKAGQWFGLTSVTYYNLLTTGLNPLKAGQWFGLMAQSCFGCWSDRLNPLKAGQWFGPIILRLLTIIGLVSIPSRRGNGSDQGILQ